VRKSISLIALLGLLLVSTAIADPGDTLWTRTYGGSGYEEGFSVHQTADGGYIASGRTNSFGAGGYDAYLVKTDAIGDTLWTHTYGGSVDPPQFGEQAQSVQQTGDGGYILAGNTKSFGAGGYDVWLVKTDANGDTLWTRPYGGSDEDQGKSVQQTTDGGYIVAGWTRSFGAGLYDVWILKTDANGDTLWTRAYGGDGPDYAHSVQQTTDGGYIVGGYTASFGAGDHDFIYVYDFWLLKTDANGDTLWARTYGGDQMELGLCVQQTTDGGYIMTGLTESFGAGGEGLYLVKTDANGDTLWTRTYGGTEDDRGWCVDQTTDGGYIIVGFTKSFSGGSTTDCYIVRTDANGDSLWTRHYGGIGQEWGYSVEQAADGSYIVTGYTDSFGAGTEDLWLLSIAGEAQAPDVSIEIVPDDPPVTVPQGGTFGYTGTVTNNTEDPQSTDIWVMAVGPLEGVYGPFKEFEEVPLAPSQSRSRHLSQKVPNVAPLGLYNYIAYCGDYPSTVMDSSFFQIEVVEGIESGQGGWVLRGSFLEGDVADIPFEFGLSGNYPNPFNASTVISYELATGAHVTLGVYNISGQKVATLVDSKQQSGYRSVVWDASEVSSGVYFYKLTAGDFSEIKRMTLLR
jgi:hypothetical protein